MGGLRKIPFHGWYGYFLNHTFTTAPEGVKSLYQTCECIRLVCVSVRCQRMLRATLGLVFWFHITAFRECYFVVILAYTQCTKKFQSHYSVRIETKRYTSISPPDRDVKQILAQGLCLEFYSIFFQHLSHPALK